jgi:hypothetical protein
VKPASRGLRVASCSAIAILFAACHGDGSTGPGTHFTGIRAVAGANATDTVQALQAQALVVQVRTDGGAIARGVVVRFESQPPADTTRRYEPAVFVCSLSTAACGDTYSNQFVTDTTDAEGRAKAIIRMGTVAGRAVVKLGVPELGMVDSVAFTVTPGAVARVHRIAADTGLDIDATAMLRGSVTDRFNNPRPELPTMSLGAGSAITLDAAKAIVTGKAMGTQWLYARYGELVDSTSVRVVPAGRLLVWAAGAREVRLVNVNGSGPVLKLASSISSDFGAFPHFDPSRRHVTMHAGTATYGGAPTNAVVVDTSTLVRRDISTLGFTTIVSVRMRDDGTVLVVGRRTGDTGYSLWRITADDAISAVAALPEMIALYDGADISRDGGKVAYIATAAAGGSELRLLDVATGTPTVLARNVRSPRFSPQADRVAFLVLAGYSSYDGTASVIDADGTNLKSLGSFVFSPGLGWSPDGTYLIGRNSGSGGMGLRLIRVSDAASAMLYFHAKNGWVEDYYQPDWR